MVTKSSIWTKLSFVKKIIILYQKNKIVFWIGIIVLSILDQIFAIVAIGLGIYEFFIFKKSVDKKIDKVAVDTEKEVEEEDLAVDNIENTFTQKFFERVYFSIITSTLLGYGDIYPITNLSKSIVMVQSLLTISLIII